MRGPMLALLPQTSGSSRSHRGRRGFARRRPALGDRAAMAAVYALQRYSQLIGQRERDKAFAGGAGARSHKMLAARPLHRRTLEPWELAGDAPVTSSAWALVARARLARDPSVKLVPARRGGRQLAAVSKEYPSYFLAQYQLADAYLQAERDNVEPPRRTAGRILPAAGAGDSYRTPDPGPSPEALAAQV